MKKIILVLVGLAVVGNSMATKSLLKTYRKRRGLTKGSKLPEPYGKVKETKSKKPMFVIQKHEASHLHYDFRLEMDGVLVSWAVPKGLPEKPGIRRLAMPTDDHPMEYGHFEGIIPEGHYGAGTVMVWDIGTYENIKEKNGKLVPMEKAYKEGSVEVILHGKKLNGAYAVIKTKGLYSKDAWIVLKMKSVKIQKSKKKKVKKDVSALTGRTMSQITKDHDAEWS